MYATVRVFVSAIVFGSGLAGCVSLPAGLPVVRGEVATIDVKMLKPGARARSCGSWVFVFPMGTPAAAQDLVAEMIGRDPEGDVLTNVQVTTSGVMTGIFNRLCVDITGDVGREISVVRLPAVGGGHEHH